MKLNSTIHSSFVSFPFCSIHIMSLVYIYIPNVSLLNILSLWVKNVRIFFCYLILHLVHLLRLKLNLGLNFQKFRQILMVVLHHLGVNLLKYQIKQFFQFEQNLEIIHNHLKLFLLMLLLIKLILQNNYYINFSDRYIYKQS